MDFVGGGDAERPWGLVRDGLLVLLFAVEPALALLLCCLRRAFYEAFVICAGVDDSSDGGTEVFVDVYAQSGATAGIVVAAVFD